MLVGLVWVLGITSTIVEPVVVGGVVAAVASPGVAWLARHGVPRAAGSALMLLALLAIGVGVFLMVVGGIVEGLVLAAPLTSAAGPHQPPPRPGPPSEPGAGGADTSPAPT